MDNKRGQSRFSNGGGQDGGPMKRPRFGDAGGGGYGDGPRGGRNARRPVQEGQVECRLLVPTRVAGRVIGKGGENVKRLRSEYNANVSIPDSTAPERVVTVIAEPENAAKVADDVFSKILEVAKGGPRGRGGDGHDQGDREEIKLLINKIQAGAVIGKAGAKIKELKEKTNANIKVFKEICPMSTDRVCNISGERQSMLSGLKEVLIIMMESPIKGPDMQYDTNNYTGINVGEYGGFPPDRNWQGPPPQGFPGPGGMPPHGGGYGGNPMGMGMGNSPYSNGNMMGGMGGGMGMGMGAMMGMGAQGAPMGGGNVGYNPQAAKFSAGMGQSGMPDGPDIIVQQVTIPKDLAGTVIGRGGEHLNRVKRESGAHVVVEPLEEGANDRIISIKGTQQAIQMAQYLLQECVRANNFGAGGGGGQRRF